MATITDKGMQAHPTATDKWLSRSFHRGGGALVGRITPAGERLFYFRYTDAEGKRKQYPLGPYHPKGDGGLTLAQAVDRASGLSGLYRSGIKELHEHFKQLELGRKRDAEAALHAEEEAAREAADAAAAAARRLTVRGLFEQWQRAELRPLVLADGTRTGRKDGGEWVRQSFERRVFPKLGDLFAEDVKKADLMSIFDAAKTEGRRRTANVLFADLSQMFRFAAEREIVPRNPLEGVKRRTIGGKDTERERVLSEAELQALRRAVPSARMAPRSAAAIWLILSTAVRVGEAMGAAWEDIDLVARTWHLPETKNQRDHTVHLSDFALEQFEILQSLREIGPEGTLVPWVFPATNLETHVCVKSFGKQLADRQRSPDQRMNNRTKATSSLALVGGKWTAHDLRRTAATLMAKLGISTDVIDECLNHKLQSKVARVYIKDRREIEQAHAFDALGRYLTSLLADVKAAQVEPQPQPVARPFRKQVTASAVDADRRLTSESW